MEYWTFSDEEMKAINKYLTFCVTNNEKCKTCVCHHSNALDNTKFSCYFASGCFLNSQKLYVPKKLSAG